VRVAAVVVAIACVACGGSGKQPEPRTPPAALDPAKGHALIDGYFATMQEFSTTAGVEPTIVRLDAQLEAGVAAHEGGAIADDVFERHQKLVAITRKLFEPLGDDDAKREAIVAEARAWATGVEGAGEIGNGPTLVAFAPAIVAEVVNLHMLIDGVTDPAQRDAYTKKYTEREEPGVKTYDVPAK
jgi:hypothetical protein